MLLEYYKNIKNNSWPLTIIGFFIVLFIFFVSKEFLRAEVEEKKVKQYLLNIGLYKSGDEDVEEYFRELEKKIHNALTCYTINIKYFDDLEYMCTEIEEENIDIAGELSPIEYINYYKRYNFVPLLGIEYNDSPFYRSCFFVIKDVKINGHTFEDKPGRDHIENIKDLLKNTGCTIVHLGDENSASGYYYPLSFLIDNKIDFAYTKKLSKNENIYKKVLKKPKNPNHNNNKNDKHKYIAGFLADFRLESYKKRFSETSKKLSKLPDEVKFPEDFKNKIFYVNSRQLLISKGIMSEEEKDKNKLLNLLEDDQTYKKAVGELFKESQPKKCGDYLAIDKSDPIPNGVFVIAKAKRNNEKLELDKLIRLWKTIKNVETREKTTITGWRTGIEKDLKAVEDLKVKVDSYILYKGHHKSILVSVLISLVIVVSGVACFILKRIKD